MQKKVYVCLFVWAHLYEIARALHLNAAPRRLQWSSSSRELRATSAC